MVLIVLSKNKEIYFTLNLKLPRSTSLKTCFLWLKVIKFITCDLIKGKNHILLNLQKIEFHFWWFSLKFTVTKIPSKINIKINLFTQIEEIDNLSLLNKNKYIQDPANDAGKNKMNILPKTKESSSNFNVKRSLIVQLENTRKIKRDLYILVNITPKIIIT